MRGRRLLENGGDEMGRCFGRGKVALSSVDLDM